MRTVIDWFAYRTGWTGPLRSLLRYPVPEPAHRNPMFAMGSMLMILFVLQAVTGMFMAFYYDPSPEGAYGSVDYIQFTLKYGWLIRGVHHWAASVMVVMVVLHLL